jgi:diadenylate cyclase
VSDLVGEIVRAAGILSNRRAGALIVIERETGLADIIDTGTSLNAVVTVELLGTIFYPGSPLHDGAVVIRGNRVAAAGCTLPLSDSPHIGTTIHTRHKAALGITEQSDAAVVVVSEETGIISVALNGKLVRGLRDEALEQRLVQILRGKEVRGVRRRLSSAGFRIARPAQSASKNRGHVDDEPEPSGGVSAGGGRLFAGAGRSRRSSWFQDKLR